MGLFFFASTELAYRMCLKVMLRSNLCVVKNLQKAWKFADRYLPGSHCIPRQFLRFSIQFLRFSIQFLRFSIQFRAKFCKFKTPGTVSTVSTGPCFWALQVMVDMWQKEQKTREDVWIQKPFGHGKSDLEFAWVLESRGTLIDFTGPSFLVPSFRLTPNPTPRTLMMDVFPQ